mgnify:CR=1 FL=1
MAGSRAGRGSLNCNMLAVVHGVRVGYDRKTKELLIRKESAGVGFRVKVGEWEAGGRVETIAADDEDGELVVYLSCYRGNGADNEDVRVPTGHRF